MRKIISVYKQIINLLLKNRIKKYINERKKEKKEYELSEVLLFGKFIKHKIICCVINCSSYIYCTIRNGNYCFHFTFYVNGKGGVICSMHRDSREKTGWRKPVFVMLCLLHSNREAIMKTLCIQIIDACIYMFFGLDYYTYRRV